MFIDLREETVALTLDDLQRVVSEITDGGADAFEFKMDLFEGGTWGELERGERPSPQTEQIRAYLQMLQDEKPNYWEAEFFHHEHTGDEARLYAPRFISWFVHDYDRFETSISQNETWIITEHGKPNLIDRLFRKAGPVKQHLSINPDDVWVLEGEVNSFLIGVKGSPNELIHFGDTTLEVEKQY